MAYLELIAPKCTVVTSCHGMSVFSIVSKVIVPKDKALSEGWEVASSGNRRRPSQAMSQFGS
jgi:hypothetical protein